jgi:hypothetical protein
MYESERIWHSRSCMSVFLFNGRGAQAPGRAVAGSVVFDLFTAINAGNMSSAVAKFAEGARLENKVVGGVSESQKLFVSSFQFIA